MLLLDEEEDTSSHSICELPAEYADLIMVADEEQAAKTLLKDGAEYTIKITGLLPLGPIYS
jgi:hypothetical protein